ncbi:MAG TPA: ATPase domain-containing protein [Chthoniobacterales bacterium]|nr:ATPase domain-containing protein [Chthoniobacterales bacterium]
MSEKTGPESARVKTGISGLDDILGGGLPPRRLYLIQGEPGSGKTTLALQFLLEGARAGEKVLYISLSETREEVEEVARSHGWSLENVEIVELSAIEKQLSASTQNTLFHASEVELTETTKLLLDAVDKVRPTRCAFDSLSELRLLSQDPLRYRRQILSFKQYFAGRNCTTLLLDDSSTEGSDSHVLSLAHGVLVLQQLAPEYGAARRRLNVQKVRGSTYRGGYHDYVIETGGLTIFPRLVAAEHHRHFVNENLSSGLPGLDELLGGGLPRGTATLFSGPPGSGKSNLALTFATNAARQRDKVAIYTFDESLPVLFARAAGLNFGLEELAQKGAITVSQVDPAELSPGELTTRIRRAVEEDGVRVVYIDSLNGYLHSMREERYVNLQLHELITYLNQQGVVTMIVIAPSGMMGQMQSPIDVTYLADSVVMFRFFEAEGAVHKALSVIKKRTGQHEHTIRELFIDAAGIRVGPPLDAFRGVLTGVPVLSEEKQEKRRRAPARRVNEKKKR